MRASLAFSLPLDRSKIQRQFLAGIPSETLLKMIQFADCGIRPRSDRVNIVTSFDYP